MARDTDMNQKTATLSFDQAIRLHEAGRDAEAEAAYRRLLEDDPRHLGAITNLGHLLMRRGADAEAERLLSAVLAFPSREALPALGNLLTLRQRLGGDQLEVWAAVATADPGNSDAWTRLAIGVRGRDPERALDLLRRAVAAEPFSPSCHNNLSVVLMDLGRVGDAISAARNALALDPDYPDALINLANTMDLANTSQNQELARQCIDLYRRAEALGSNSVGLQFNLANVLKRMGRLDEARACCRRIVELEGPGGASLREVLIAPRVFESNEAIARYRADLLAGLDRLQQSGLRLADPLHMVGETGFGLAYHNYNDRDIQCRIAEFYRAVTPGLEWVAPHCREPRRPRPKGARIRLGIVGSYRHNKTLDNLNEGLIRNLSRERFEIVFLRPGGVADDGSDAMDALVDKVVHLTNDLDGARQTVAAQELDALFYFEIGMVVLAYFLAFSRLAPVQCVTWGHPDTTGIPAMDYFLSSTLLEPEDGDEHYSERLIRLQHLPTCYPRPPVEEVAGDRARLGLPEGVHIPEDAHIYVCPQNLMKIHPDFDEVVGRILAEDDKGYLLITTSAMVAWEAVLHRRIARRFPDLAERVIFLPQMSRLDFMNLLTVADVNLDPFHFSGGNSTHEALALGSPVVTWPGAYMRGRVSLGLYRRMGFEDLIASDPDDYVAKALRLARDKDWNRSVRETIRRRSAILFDNIAMVREFEGFIEAAVAAAERKDVLTEWKHP